MNIWQPDDEPPHDHAVWLVFLTVMGLAGFALLLWAAIAPTAVKAAEQRAWLVPTITLNDGREVRSAHGWHPRPYPSQIACEKQRAYAALMTPPNGAKAVRWECLPFNPAIGKDA